MMLYIGSDNEFVEWQGELEWETETLIHVGDIPKVYAGVKKHFTKKYQYAVSLKTGMGMGCACGFGFDEADDIDDITQNDELNRRILGEIFDYIRKFVSGGSCELVSCWTGDENKDCEYSETISINDFNWKGKFSISQPQDVFKGKLMKIFK